MGDINQINDVASANINQVNDVAKANINEVNDQGVAASGATVWSGVHLDREVSFATTDLTSWSSYDAFQGAQSGFPSLGTDPYHMAYGKDGSGDPRWVCMLNNSADEIMYTDNPSNGNNWTLVTNLSNGNDIAMKGFVVTWGNNVWMAAGTAGGTLLRSTDGAAWAEVDVSGATNINANKQIYALISDGAGTWWFAQENRIYKSTNDGTQFSLHHTLLDAGGSDPGDIRSFAYTNNTLVALCKTTGDMFAAASSDTTDWSNETTLQGISNFGQQTRMAAAGGRVIIAYNQKVWVVDVSGKSITVDQNNAFLIDNTGSHGNAVSLSTDGTTWIVGCNDGDVLRSTDSGDNWSIADTNVAGSNFQMTDHAPNVYLPL
jgi:hypothetical protein